ncbi:SMAD/FHA domain [Pseudocohnilembus persalinus]|uniref:SMAD/FHA domain n=1 Tax=Pseudocohnilembus persalinus TaxID=266149 RepID=A0A0V0QRC5_PSEPJ|nr:SMAD/FHA domain [Pseudocohnilembus persalinus]|eukprot:KRX04576.1 SMAD/FHA domain [Pseudocohnilembus persalinus]
MDQLELQGPGEQIQMDGEDFDDDGQIQKRQYEEIIQIHKKDKKEALDALEKYLKHEVDLKFLTITTSVEIKVVTWNKDSHGLFDYESKSIKVNKQKITQPCQLIRKDDITVEQALISQELSDDQKKNYITSVISKDNQLAEMSQKSFMENPQIVCNKQDQSLDNFLIVRSIKDKEGQQKGYVLQPGDILKLGRIEYLVQEINDGKDTKTVQGPVSGDYQQIYEVTEEDLKAQQTQSQSELGGAETEGQQRLCRICYFEDNQEDNFLISPCSCKGSCEFVHYQCLKTWVQSKIKRKEQGSTISYNWKISECEICNSTLPKKIKKQEQVFDLVDIQKPDCPYLLLEVVTKDKKIHKNLFLIQAHNNQQLETKLGRGHECDVRISDISVSRKHAFIKFKDGNFVITDNNSKFGTLIKMKTPIPVTQDKVAIQVGRTVITFVIKSESQQQQQQQQNQIQMQNQQQQGYEQIIQQTNGQYSQKPKDVQQSAQNNGINNFNKPNPK